ncbi:hypothetical protein NDU88_002582 [Pleurodeles waltl]|uniref:Uncharacterized protein n=1 Tax=Pleurodeles waltl TaxID=8319 RepID=A0AAV7W2T0_PLEWA|nr:hypothetical protein NDU88_002582 [Pleurodeles waltl]
MVRARQAGKKNPLAGSGCVDVTQVLLSNTDTTSAVCCEINCTVSLEEQEIQRTAYREERTMECSAEAHRRNTVS